MLLKVGTDCVLTNASNKNCIKSNFLQKVGERSYVYLPKIHNF